MGNVVKNPKYPPRPHHWFCLCCWIQLDNGQFYCTPYCKRKHTGECLTSAKSATVVQSEH